ncbi:tail completion protein gp17 [Caenibacillus caldisaponilyticus]|uniref:tail completion protein gp17 n=1 Tax=Caenibacillus caldisaponilyticus TaxID=1674942 RepID=UPI0009884D45|nr:DUF3168 domain-containing protein [Caenibacillus caldisaponilyticus]
MIDVKPQIYQAMINDSQLVALLGGKNVYQIKEKDATVFPRITFFELDNYESRYADDAAFVAEIRIQIDVWHTDNYSSIVNRVNEIMESLGFVRYFATDLFESETEPKLFHKALRYKISKVIEE